MLEMAIPYRPVMSTDRHLGRSPRAQNAGELGPLGTAIPYRPSMSTDRRLGKAPHPSRLVSP